MDWIDEVIRNVKQRFMRKYTLQKSMTYCIFVAIFFVILCFLVTRTFCAGWRALIEKKYITQLDSAYLFHNFGMQSA